MSTPKTGQDLKLYYNSGTHASPTWVLISQVEDVRIDELRWDAAELKRRSTPYVQFLKTLVRIGCRFKLYHKLDSTVFDALRASALSRTDAKQFYIANGPAATSGTEGLRFFAQILEFPWDQSLTEVSSHDVMIRPTYYEESGAEVLPDWYVIS